MADDLLLAHAAESWEKQVKDGFPKPGHPFMLHDKMTGSKFAVIVCDYKDGDKALRAAIDSFEAR